MGFLERVKSYWRFLCWYWPLHFKTILEYKTSFLIQALTMLVNDAFMVFFWWIFFANLNPVNGWGFGEILLLLSMGTISFGLFEIFFGGARTVQQKVLAGNLDFYLTKPKSVLQHLLVSRMEFSAFGELLFGYAAFYFSGYWTLANFVLFHFYALFSGFLFAFCMLLFDLPVFWVGRSEKLSRELRDALFHFSTYPVDLFGGVVKIFLFTILPSAFLTNVPAQLLIRFDPFWLIALILFVLFFAFAVSKVFYAGIKKYESGNLVDIRV